MSAPVVRAPIAAAVLAVLLLGALRAFAQGALDDLDTGPGGVPAAMRARWSSAPTVDVDPNEPGSHSAGLQEALSRCPGGAAGCILQLRADTTYVLAPHSTWPSATGGPEPLTAFQTNGADDVWLRGHGDGSVIAYTQVGSGPDRLLRNFMLTANNGSDRILFSDFRVERTDQCTVDCQDYAMVFTALGNVSDVVIDRVSVRSTQLVHDGTYPGRNVFMVFAIAYPAVTPRNTPRRLRVQNSRFSMSSSGIHTNHCDDCSFVGNQFDAAGVPDDDNGATVRAFSTFKGRKYLIARNAIDLALNGRIAPNWTACIKLSGDQTSQPTQPPSARVNEGATVIGNLCTGLRQQSAAGVYFEGYRDAVLTGNRIYAGVCSNDALRSCRVAADCSGAPAPSCDPAPAKAFYFADQQWLNANSNRGNALRSNRFGDGTNCAVRVDSTSNADPNSNTANLFAGNIYRLSAYTGQTFCGSGAAKAAQNTQVGEVVQGTSAAGKGDATLWDAGAAVDGAWLLSDELCSDPAQNALPIESSALIQHASGLARVDGWATGFGTAGDFVRIEYGTDFPESVTANPAQAGIVDWGPSRLCIYIDDPSADNGGRDTLVDGWNAPLCSVVEHCTLTGSVRPGTRALTPSGTAGAKCGGADLHAPLSAAQVASVLAAFPSGNRCSVRLRSLQPDRISSLAIKLEQRERSRVAP